MNIPADRREHRLKVWPSFFGPLARREKRFEVRSTRDRDFSVGDKLVLREWDPQKGRMVEGQGYTSRAFRCHVTYVMAGGRFGIDEHTAILGLSEGETGKSFDGGDFYPDEESTQSSGLRAPSEETK